MMHQYKSQRRMRLVVYHILLLLLVMASCDPHRSADDPNTSTDDSLGQTEDQQYLLELTNRLKDVDTLVNAINTFAQKHGWLEELNEMKKHCGPGEWDDVRIQSVSSNDE